MNAKQRRNNRVTASTLNALAKQIRLSKHICENCGKPGGHWIQGYTTLEDIINNVPESGFWICEKYYDKGGKRKNEE